jgi:membrane carboxypeptidase/penicillin-binding protein PbpC
MKVGQTIIRTILWLSAAGALALIAATGYYANEVRVARATTPSLVSETLKRFGVQLKLADLSKERQAMLLAIEDPAFIRHHGVDLETPGAGMTTITQGLVKLIYFPEGFKQGIAKVRQTLIAQYALDSLVSKNDQLQLFLNICYRAARMASLFMAMRPPPGHISARALRNSPRRSSCRSWQCT